MLVFIVNPPGGVKMRAGETHLSVVTHRHPHRFRMVHVFPAFVTNGCRVLTNGVPINEWLVCVS
jgi:hypothetical protein